MRGSRRRRRPGRPRSIPLSPHRRHRLPALRRRLAAAAAGLALAGAAPACRGGLADALTGGGAGAPGSALGDGSAAAAAPEGCSDGRFAREVWAPVLATSCFGCHIQGGMAQAHQSRFVLVPPSEADYIAKNLAAARAMAAIDEAGGALLWRKPTGQSAHGGGVVLPMGSPGERALAAFIAADDPRDDCLGPLPATARSAAVLISEQEAISRAALVLSGRQATAAELSAASAGKLAEAVSSLVDDPGFDSLVHRLYDDILLTDGFVGANIPTGWWKGNFRANIWFPDTTPNHVVVSWGMTQQPLQLIAHVVRQDRPFTEILTADYLMVNALAACSFVGAGHSMPFGKQCSASGQGPINTCIAADLNFAALDACSDFLPLTPPASAAPLCGIFSDPTLLNVLPTTPSNRNRHRAGFIMEKFLDTPPLSFGAQLAPSAQATGDDPAEVPTLTDPRCVSCHQVVDGIASSLRNWPAYERFNKIGQPADMTPPALFGAAQAAGSSEEPLCWLAGQIAADPRFARATVKTWLTALTGQASLDDPQPADPNYLLRLSMKLEQNAFIDDMAAQFAADGFVLRRLLARLVASPYFRAVDLEAGGTPEDRLQAGLFGHAQRRGPEQLHRVLVALTGRAWNARSAAYATTASQRAYATYLLNDFLTSYGGIDARATTERNTDMSSVMAAIANLMSIAVPCQAAAADFSLPATARLLYPLVELTDLPDGGGGTAAIRANLQHLYRQLLGEALPAAGAEMDAAYGLFATVVGNHANDPTLAPACASGKITGDPHGTLHAWMAVTASLLADFGMLYE